jgi:hypothetical protein
MKLDLPELFAPARIVSGRMPSLAGDPIDLKFPTAILVIMDGAVLNVAMAFPP